jgi:accessory gene regulator B
MIKNLSENITDYFYLNNIINKEEKELYIYGLHLIISSIIGITIILTLGLIFNIFSNTFLFLISFISIRMYSGGYHAKSYIKCNITLITIYLIMFLIVNYTPTELICLSSILLSIITVFIILKFAPTDNKNKKLTPERKKTNKNITLIILTIFYVLGLTIYKFNMQSFYTIVVTMFMVAILILVKVKGGENYE